MIFAFLCLVCTFLGEVFRAAFCVAFMARADPIALVCWVCASVDFDQVVDGGCGCALAPVAGGVVLEEFEAGYLVGRGVNVAAWFAFASHVGCRRPCSLGRPWVGP